MGEINQSSTTPNRKMNRMDLKRHSLSPWKSFIVLVILTIICDNVTSQKHPLEIQIDGIIEHMKKQNE